MNPNDKNTELEQELADQLVDIKDLREAIQIMKDSMLLKADNPFIKLQYVDTKKHGGNLHHILKGDDCSYHVIKNNQRQSDPYSISVRKDGKEVQRSPNYYTDIHEVSKALMSYHKNKKWGADDIVKSIFDHVSLKKAKIDSTFEPESRNKLREIRNVPKDLTGTNEGYNSKGVNKPVAMQRRASEVVQFAKQPKPNLPKSELDKAGVHEPISSVNPGTSMAGAWAKGAVRANPSSKNIRTSDAKEMHADKLKELKAMPKPNLPKSEDSAEGQELDKGSKNVREQKKKIFGSDANAPRMSDKRAKMMGVIKQFAEKQYKLPLQIASGKRDDTGAIRTDKENQPAFDVFTPKGREAEKQLLAQQKESGVKRVDPKPDWRSGKLETQPSPDAALHELAHLNIAPEKMDIATFQEHMDDKWGDSQSKYGHMQQKKTHGEIQPMSVENSLRRQMGLPANKATKPVTENQRALDYEGDRFVQGKDAKGKTAFYDRQTRLQTPETKDRLEQIKQGTVKFNPKKGWEPANDTNALINLRGQGKHKEAADRLRSRMALAKPAQKAEVTIGAGTYDIQDKDLPQHQAAINAEKYADIKVDEVKKSMDIKKPTHVAGVPIPKELHSFVHGSVAVPEDHPHREMAAKFVGDIWKQNKLEGKRMSGNLLNVHAPELQTPASAVASKPSYSTMKNDETHPEGSPEDKAHDAIEQQQTVSSLVDSNSGSSLTKIFDHLKAKKENPDWARSSNNMNLEDMNKSNRIDAELMSLKSKTASRQKGVHPSSAVYGDAGKSKAGAYNSAATHAKKYGNDPSNLMGKYNNSRAKQEHKKVLSEIQAQPKPNLPKSEDMEKAQPKLTAAQAGKGMLRRQNAEYDIKGVNMPIRASINHPEAKEQSFQGVRVRRGDMSGAKGDAKHHLSDLKAQPKPNLPKSEECGMDMPMHMKLKKQLGMCKVDPNSGLPGTVLDKAKVDEGLSPQVKNQARFYRNKPFSPGSLNERFTAGVHKPAFGAKTGTSNMGAVSNNNTRKEQVKRVTGESKAMPKPNLPKSEDMEKRCWEGYKAVPGKKPYSEGSCTKDLGKSKGATTAHKVVLHALKAMPKPNLPKSEKVTAMDKDKMVHVSNDPKVLDKKNC